jgi:hypothetical protein
MKKYQFNIITGLAFVHGTGDVTKIKEVRKCIYSITIVARMPPNKSGIPSSLVFCVS